MFVRSSLVVIFLHILLTNVECSVMSIEAENTGRSQQDWIFVAEIIDKQLMYVHAFIAKDEELQGDCMTTSRKSNKKHLMCAGSILTREHVLTSATCIHEATHIRHNLKAPLVVVISPTSEGPQVIKVHSYEVHPKHIINSKKSQHTRYNVAVIKLACSIIKPYFYQIKLPWYPYKSVCSPDLCELALIRKVGKYANAVSPKTLIIQEKKVLPTVDGIANTTNIADQYLFQSDSSQNDRQRLISVRSTNGFRGCPQSGSPVMYGKTQAALVSISCDDRQPRASWKYTDIYLNLDWIEKQMKLDSQNTKTESPEPDKFTTKGSSACIYNFFISLTDSNDKTNCSDLSLNFYQCKMCALHNGRKMVNKQTSIPKKYADTSRNLQLQIPPEQIGPRRYETGDKIKNEGKENVEKSQKLGENSSQIAKNLPKNNTNLAKNVAKFSTNLIANVDTDISIDYGKDLGRVLKMDFNQDFEKDSEKNFQNEFQKDFQRDLKKDFNRDYDGGLRPKFMKDHYYSRNMEVPNENRLRKENVGNEGHESIKQNKYKNLNSSKVQQTMSPQQKNYYNPLSKKFRNLRKVLARIHKSIPETNLEKVVFWGQRKISPKKETSNSAQSVEYFREEKMQAVADKQFAVFVRDREKDANNHLNVYPGFNGYFL